MVKTQDGLARFYWRNAKVSRFLMLIYTYTKATLLDGSIQRVLS